MKAVQVVAVGAVSVIRLTAFTRRRPRASSAPASVLCKDWMVAL
jgi:hypothetical protein